MTSTCRNNNNSKSNTNRLVDDDLSLEESYDEVCFYENNNTSQYHSSYNCKDTTWTDNDATLTETRMFRTHSDEDNVVSSDYGLDKGCYNSKNATSFKGANDDDDVYDDKQHEMDGINNQYHHNSSISSNNSNIYMADDIENHFSSHYMNHQQQQQYVDDEHSCSILPTEHSMYNNNRSPRKNSPQKNNCHSPRKNKYHSPRNYIINRFGTSDQIRCCSIRLGSTTGTSSSPCGKNLSPVLRNCNNNNNNSDNNGNNIDNFHNTYSECDWHCQGSDDDADADEDDDARSLNTHKQDIIGKMEKKRIQRYRYITILMFVCSAIVLGYCTVYFTKSNEKKQFQHNFYQISNFVSNHIQIELLNVLSSLDELATSMSIQVTTTPNTTSWPYSMTIPKLTTQVAKVQSRTIAFNTYSIVLLNGTTERFIWERFVQYQYPTYIQDGIQVMNNDLNYHQNVTTMMSNNITTLASSLYNSNGTVPYNLESRLYAPQWISYPFPLLKKYNSTNQEEPSINWDWYSTERKRTIIDTIRSEQRAILSEPYILPDPNNPIEVAAANYWSEVYSNYINKNDNSLEPVSDIEYPVLSNQLDRLDFDSNNSTNSSTIIAILGSSFYWRDIFKNNKVSSYFNDSIVLVIDNPCTESFTYQIDAWNPSYLGRGDLHNPKFDTMMMQETIFDVGTLVDTKRVRYSGVLPNQNYCTYRLRVYPSERMENQYISNKPYLLGGFIVLLYTITTIIFVVYDAFVRRRHDIVMDDFAQSKRMLASLFPSVVREQLISRNRTVMFENNDDKVQSPPPSSSFDIEKTRRLSTKLLRFSVHKNKIHSLPNTLRNSWNNNNSNNNNVVNINGNTINNFTDNDNGLLPPTSPPIADLYPDTTIFFSDIRGFTEWSSKRNPNQVFSLLETLYFMFDSIARRRRVFKVETIGDSYVAAAGLPHPMKNHATTIVRFAVEVMQAMTDTVNELCESLGSDTANLQLRIGINSGPTTAGVIRGAKSRFQLFGDTVNTASRMESTGSPGRIQCTQYTADILIEAGKEHWLTKREILIEAKGKGVMQTFWVKPSRKQKNSEPDSPHYDDESPRVDSNSITFHSTSILFNESKDDQQTILIDKIYNIFHDVLKNVAGMRHLSSTQNDPTQASNGCSVNKLDASCVAATSVVSTFHKIAIGVEFKFIERNHIESDRTDFNKSEQTIDDSILIAIRDLITSVALWYPSNPYHNFEHACSVAIQTKELLNMMRIEQVAKHSINQDTKISSMTLRFDPADVFAILYGALIHDIDHSSVSNDQPAQKVDLLALANHTRNRGKQNAIDVGWTLLMQPQYNAITDIIFKDEAAFQRCRQIIINTVLMSDIHDKHLESFQESHWNREFVEQQNQEKLNTIIQIEDDERAKSHLHRQATDIVALIVQTADNMHLLHNWSTYKQWSIRRYHEIYLAHRTDNDDDSIQEKIALSNAYLNTSWWYENEVSMFDTTIIPLLNKINQCSILDPVYLEALLRCAISNRDHLVSLGHEIFHEPMTQFEVDNEKWGEDGLYEK